MKGNPSDESVTALMLQDVNLQKSHMQHIFTAVHHKNHIHEQKKYYLHCVSGPIQQDQGSICLLVVLCGLN